MKIGIMTFWWSDDNYGQLLQCYALQKYLRDRGYDAYLIRYDSRNDYVKTPFLKKVLKAFNPVTLFHYCYYKSALYNKIENKIEKTNALRKFERFREHYIKQSERIYYSYDALLDEPPEADVYLAGSDQVWNPDFLVFSNTKNQVKAYFLGFGAPEKKRIAYAASFGKESVADDFIREITPLLQRFDYISVREKSGAAICRQCGVNAEWVPDPTMLLSTADYRTLYTHAILRIEKPYCLLYMINNTSDFSITAVYDWAKRKELEVVYVTANRRYDNRQKVYATIPEWLYLIDNAEYVVTNSFHGSVFSLLFQKRFGIIPLSGNLVETNSRFYSLFETFAIKERFIDSTFKVLDTDIDWNKIEDRFKKIQSSCTMLNAIQSIGRNF
jgi:hypothetical protein